MAYRFNRERTVEENIRCIAGQQIDRAIGELDDPSLGRHEVVHQVRKRCKKLRGLIRLVRSGFDDYGKENAFFRDAARPLSYVRDAQSVIECYDGLVERFGEQVDRQALAPVRAALASRRKAIVEDEVALQNRIEAFLHCMHEARRRVADWKIDPDGFDALAGGIEKTYRRAREGLRRAYDNPGVGTFHEWRKRVKYHWYHNRLLRPIWPEMMRVEIAATDRLADLLGDEHDLAVFADVLLNEGDCFDSSAGVEVLIGLGDRYRAELQALARPLGQRVFAEKPARFVRRYARYWAVWRGGVA